MHTDLPSRIDSGILLNWPGEVHRRASRGRTVCDIAIPEKHTKVSDNAILVRRLSKCRDCWKVRP